MWSLYAQNVLFVIMNDRTLSPSSIVEQRPLLPKPLNSNTLRKPNWFSVNVQKFDLITAVFYMGNI